MRECFPPTLRMRAEKTTCPEQPHSPPFVAPSYSTPIRCYSLFLFKNRDKGMTTLPQPAPTRGPCPGHGRHNAILRKNDSAPVAQVKWHWYDIEGTNSTTTMVYTSLQRTIIAREATRADKGAIKEKTLMPEGGWNENAVLDSATSLESNWIWFTYKLASAILDKAADTTHSTGRVIGRRWTPLTTRAPLNHPLETVTRHTACQQCTLLTAFLLRVLALFWMVQ